MDGRWLAAVVPEFAGAKVAVSPVGAGQLADTFRLSLDWGIMQDGRPSSLVCKLASSDASSREISAHWRLYEREVRFYRELAPAARIDTPHVHASGLAEDGSFFLLMEDLNEATPGNQLSGLQAGQAPAAMREAARLHAAFWARADDPALGWLETGRIAQAFYSPEVFRSAWRDFRDRYRGMVPDSQLRLCDAFADLYEAYARPLSTPRCVVHNDFRPDNMMFAANRLTVLDWQSVALGFNALDVAYAIGGGFEPDERRSEEQALLDLYHATLIAEGVEDYSRDQLDEDYRHFCFAGIVVSVCAAMLVKRTERGDRMFLTMLDRHAQHAADCDGIGLLRAR